MSKKKNKDRKPRYECVQGVVDQDVAFIQAINALDVAATLAVESRDAASLAAVASNWLRLGESLGRLSADQEEDEHGDLEADTEAHVTHRVPVGFTRVED